MVAASEHPVDTVREGTSATDMAQEIFGSGVAVTGVTYYGDIDSAGTYSNGDDVMPGVTPSDTGVILSTGNAQDFTNRRGQANQDTDTGTNINDINNGGGTLTITHINGKAVSVGSTTTLPTSQDVALIATPTGDRRAKTLRAGHMVNTKDEGPQPLRWIGLRNVAATDDFAPIHIGADTLGQHRDLVNDHSITRREGGSVTYVHLLFDRHQVVISEGLETESFLPGPQTATSFEAEAVAEIHSLFPELDPETGQGYPTAARRMPKRYEAELLCAAEVA